MKRTQKSSLTLSIILSIIFTFIFTTSSMAIGKDDKFAVIDVRKIFLEYKETKNRKKALSGEIDKLQVEINAKKKIVDELKEKIETLGKALKPGDQSLKAKKTLEEMRAMSEDYREKMGELREMYKQYSLELQNKEEKEIQLLEVQLEEKVRPILEKIARERDYFGIFEKRSVFFGGKDITLEIIETLNR